MSRTKIILIFVFWSFDDVQLHKMMKSIITLIINDDHVPGLGPEHRHAGHHHPHTGRAHRAHRGYQGSHWPGAGTLLSDWSVLDHVTRILISDWFRVGAPSPSPESRAAPHIGISLYLKPFISESNSESSRDFYI